MLPISLQLMSLYENEEKLLLLILNVCIINFLTVIYEDVYCNMDTIQGQS